MGTQPNAGFETRSQGADVVLVDVPVLPVGAVVIALPDGRAVVTGARTGGAVEPVANPGAGAVPFDGALVLAGLGPPVPGASLPQPSSTAPSAAVTAATRTDLPTDLMGFAPYWARATDLTKHQLERPDE